MKAVKLFITNVIRRLLAIFSPGVVFYAHKAVVQLDHPPSIVEKPKKLPVRHKPDIANCRKIWRNRHGLNV